MAAAPGLTYLNLDPIVDINFKEVGPLDDEWKLVVKKHINDLYPKLTFCVLKRNGIVQLSQLDKDKDDKIEDDDSLLAVYDDKD
ncbi:hypothetical protein BGW39_007887 [Mortierella sp. 14UC]|nr:hypothetical protein BGW39_007887 [Mortierella sp. 14UC]